MSDVEVRIRIDDDEDLAAAQDLVDQYPNLEMQASSGTPAPGVEGQIEPISAILIGAGVTLVVKFVTDWWEKRRGGLVIDEREGAEDEIYRDRDIPYGYIVIYPPDGGSVKLETKNMPKDAMQQLLESLITGAFKSVSDVASAAREKLSTDKVEVAAA
jgi:hypothetical protein